MSSYIGSIAHNQFVTWLRKRGARPTETFAAHGMGDAPAHVARAMTTGDHDRADDRLAARWALSRLPREWQSLLVARYVEGCTIDALVSVNGTSRATLNRELKRAREAFCAALVGGEGGSS